jgi:hypothetical protein
MLYLDKVQYLVGAQYGFQQVLVITDGDNITATDLEGEILTSTPAPPPASPTPATAGHPDPTPTNRERHRRPET